MTFIEALKETEDSIKAKAFMPTMRSFESFFIGGVRLSIQASEFHYCTPRETIELDQYTAMEFAIITLDGKFIRVSDVLPGIEEVEDYYDQVYVLHL